LHLHLIVECKIPVSSHYPEFGFYKYENVAYFLITDRIILGRNEKM